MVLGSSPVAVTSPSDFAPASSKEFLDIQANIECGFTLKRVRDMTRTYSPEFNTLAPNVFNARLAQANLVTKTDFDNSVSSRNNKIAANKTKNESIEYELKKLKTFDPSYFIGKSHFEEDGTQNYLVFQPLNEYFKIIASIHYVSS